MRNNKLKPNSDDVDPLFAQLFRISNKWANFPAPPQVSEIANKFAETITTIHKKNMELRLASTNPNEAEKYGHRLGKPLGAAVRWWFDIGLEFCSQDKGKHLRTEEFYLEKYKVALPLLTAARAPLIGLIQEEIDLLGSSNKFNNEILKSLQETCLHSLEVTMVNCFTNGLESD